MSSMYGMGMGGNGMALPSPHQTTSLSSSYLSNKYDLTSHKYDLAAHKYDLSSHSSNKYDLTSKYDLSNPPLAAPPPMPTSMVAGATAWSTPRTTPRPTNAKLPSVPWEASFLVQHEEWKRNSHRKHCVEFSEINCKAKPNHEMFTSKKVQNWIIESAL